MNDTANLVQRTEDVCALPLTRRLAAMLDRDPLALRDGDPLPRGWHVMLFNAPTMQSQLRADGAADLGFTFPDLGLPRLMLGGRQMRFTGDIPIGAPVRRESRQSPAQVKEGRSGRFALVTVEHRIFVAGATEPVIVESNDYVLRAASTQSAAPTSAATPALAQPATPTAVRTITPDERMLFRYSSITDNPHRIHYDHGYATGTEGYPALIVNGSIPAMFLLELYRTHAGREPVAFSSRNVAPMYCGHPLRLSALDEGASWRLWAQDTHGATLFDARAE
jgi:3-methylfumaryl-CoA hydratase